MILAKNHKILKFSKGLYKTSRMQHFDYQIIFGVKCNSELGQMNKKPCINQSRSQLRVFGEFLILRKMREENANKNHYVYEMMVVLRICYRKFGIPSPGYPGS